MKKGSNNKYSKLFTIKATEFNDTLHEDGSKTYETIGFGYITILNPELVYLIEELIKTGRTGYFYVPYLERFKNLGLDIYNEFDKAMIVLD